MKKIDAVIVKGQVNGTCPKCGETYTGELGHLVEDITLACSSPYCGHRATYYYRWPEELPPVTLRYKTSRQLVGYKSKKTKPRTDPNVLPGQLKLPLKGAK